MTRLIFALAIASVSLTALAQITLRYAMRKVGTDLDAGTDLFGTLINLFRNVYLLGGLALYAISIVVWLIVLSRAEVSAAYPLASLGFIITAVIAYFLLGEQVTFMRLSGILLICLGVILVASSA